MQLNRSEKFWIHCKRNRITTNAAAELYKASVWKIMQWQTDETRDDIPEIDVGELSRSEYALILRRRSGLDMHELAAMTGVSRMTVHNRQKGKGDLEAQIKVLEEHLHVK